MLLTPSLRAETLSQLLAEKTLEVDFFRGALQKVEARRQRKAPQEPRFAEGKDDSFRPPIYAEWTRLRRHDSRFPGNEQNVYDKPEWVRFAMDLPMAATPGTVAHYCSAGPLIPGRIVEHASGQSVLQFAEATLFKPLGFSG